MKNLPRIIRILAKGYETQFSSVELDKKINMIFDNFKNNESLKVYVDQAKDKCEDKLLTKLKALFP